MVLYYRITFKTKAIKKREEDDETAAKQTFFSLRMCVYVTITTRSLFQDCASLYFISVNLFPKILDYHFHLLLFKTSYSLKKYGYHFKMFLGNTCLSINGKA